MIQPIVEGVAELEALPVLLRRMAAAMHLPNFELGRPIRCKRSLLLKPDELEKTIELARSRPGCRGILIVFDADEFCPKNGALPLQEQARMLAGRHLPCSVVVANKEYEAWFLASLESFGGNPYPGDPDGKRGAKEELERSLGIYYNAAADQPSFSARMRLEAAYDRSRSFRKLTKEFRSLLRELGYAPAVWPTERADT